MIGSIKAEHKTTKNREKTGSRISPAMTAESQLPRAAREQQQYQGAALPLQDTNNSRWNNDIYSCPVAIKWSLLSAFLSVAVQWEQQGWSTCVCVICAVSEPSTVTTSCKNSVSTGKRLQVPVRGRTRATRLCAGVGIVCLTPFPFCLLLAGQFIQWSTLECSSLVSLAFWGRKSLFTWVSSLALHTQLSAPH